MPRTARAANRLPRILDEAARLFAERGYHGASVRDIVRAVDMLPGSLYYHFANKDELLAGVYAEGVHRLKSKVNDAIAKPRDPWAKLEAACVAHLEGLLDPNDYAQVVVRVRPSDAPAIGDRLIALRADYEALFRALVASLALPPGTDRRAFRLLLLGALNWSQTWYRTGRWSPRRIARQYVALLRTGRAE